MHTIILFIFRVVTSSASVIAAIGLCIVLLTGCAGGTVQFVDPPVVDVNGVTHYVHPSGVFSLDAPRSWSLYEQNTTTLASAAFGTPDQTAPVLLFAVIDLGTTLDPAGLTAAIDRYQVQTRPDAAQYLEVSREAIAEGEWRTTGYRRTTSGNVPINTFFKASGSRLAVIEITPDAAPTDDLTAQIEQVINSFTLDPSAPLDPSDVSTLAYAKPSSLAILHTRAWTADDGALFVTGEIANHGSAPVSHLPVDVSILASDGSIVHGAVDTPLGYGIAPGGFAPFSLRFGEGAPADGGDYLVRLGGDEGPQGDLASFSNPDELTWTDSSQFDAQNHLTIGGQVTNVGQRPLRQLRAIVTIFDDQQQVIGAAQADLDPTPLQPGESREFSIPITALGDVPQNYIVTVQGLP